MGQGCWALSVLPDASVPLGFTDRARDELKRLGQRSHLFKMKSEA